MTIITIDGPSGAGKSTIAKLLAEKLNFEYLDTGAMYRAITLYLIENKIPLNNELSIERSLENIKIDYKNKLLYMNNREIGNEIRSVLVTDNVSLVSSYKAVREKLVEQQRKISEENNTVLDGRDTGSVVVPYANYKFYLTASPEVRAKRRYLQYPNGCYEEIYASILRRDEFDSTREISPLVIPNGAIVIDSSNLTIEETVKKMLSEVENDSI